MATKWASWTERGQPLDGADLMHLVNTICLERKRHLHQQTIPPYTEAEEKLQRAIDEWLEIVGRRSLQKAVWEFTGAYQLVFGPEESSWESLLNPTCLQRVLTNHQHMLKRTTQQSKADSIASMKLLRKIEAFQPWPLRSRFHQLQYLGYPSFREIAGAKPPTLERLNSASKSLGETSQMRPKHAINSEKRISCIPPTTDEPADSPFTPPSPSSSPSPSGGKLEAQATPCKSAPAPRNQATRRKRPSREDDPTKDVKLPSPYPPSVKSTAGYPPAKSSLEPPELPMAKRKLDCGDIEKPTKRPKRQREGRRASRTRHQVQSRTPSQREASPHTGVETTPAPSPATRDNSRLAAAPSMAACTQLRPPPDNPRGAKAGRRYQYDSRSREVGSSQEGIPARERKQARDLADKSRRRSPRRKERHSEIWRKKQGIDVRDIESWLRELETLFSTYTATEGLTRKAR